MARQDLIAALRNALERGETIEQAKMSLLNSGYKKEEVEEAIKELEKLRSKPLKPPSIKFPSLPTPPKA
ncbi:MAG: hypothetical protein N3G19_03265 [Candidatus Pacearchaeota archaeon]|nr:hypothetical protein [Candidatus Pacearchaeota archaeon]